MLTFISFIAVMFTMVFTLIAALEGNALVLWSRFYSYFIDAALLFFSYLITRINQEHSKALFDFGLGKLESFAGILLSVAVVFYIGVIVSVVFYRIIHPVPLTQNIFAIILFLIFISKDIYMYIQLNNYTKHQHSKAINSQKRYHVISLASNSLVLLPLILISFFDADSLIPMSIDIIAAMVLCFATAYLSYGVGKRAAFDLLDTALDESVQFEILKHLAKHFDLYEQFNGQTTRQAGNKKYIELFFEFDHNKSYAEILQHIEIMRQDIQQAIPDSRVLIVPVASKK